jgi:tripartite-type tricarboxylate transporter receptor subunit TctC
LSSDAIASIGVPLSTKESLPRTGHCFYVQGIAAHEEDAVRLHDGRRVGVVAGLAFAAMMGAALAQDYPSRPITIVVPFTAGGPADTAARTISDALRRQIGQSLVIENRPGASGIPAVEALVHGGADGYSLLLGGIAPIVLIPPIQNVRYDVEKDLVPLGLIWRSPQVFAVSTKLGVSTAAEFVARARANPGKVSIGSAGNGTVTHLANELLRREAAIDFVHVPYRSTANSLTDLIGGHIDAIFGDVAILQPQVQSGAIKALAITSTERSPLLPDLATTAEVGLPKVQTEVWYGLLAPARAPAGVLSRLETAAANAQRDPAFRESLAKYGISAPPPGREFFARFIREEAARWTPIVQSVKMN